MPFCGISVKAANLSDHTGRVHHVEIGENAVPSAGTLARFYSKHHDEAKRLLDGVEDDELEEMREKVKGLVQENPLVVRAHETGRFSEVILSLERLKDEVGGEATLRWVRDQQLEVLCQWKPLFEDDLASDFYGRVCKTCRRIDKEESQCREGYSNCMYDEAFLEFERDAIERFVNSLRNGQAET